MAGGQQINTGQGNVTYSRGDALTGDEATSAAGSIGEASRLVRLFSRKVGGGASTRALAGIQMAVMQGAIHASPTLVGRSASTALGSLVPNRQKALTGSAITSAAGSVDSGPTWSQTVPTIQFTQGTSSTHSLVQYTSGFNSAQHEFQQISGTLPAGVTLNSATGYVYDGTSAVASASNIVIRIADKATAAVVTGLEWGGNETTSLRRMLYWNNPFPIYPATYIFRVYPKGPKTGTNERYWTTFFWGNNGIFEWDTSATANTYYGAHPYPFSGNLSNNGQNWEISVYSQDVPPVSPNNGAQATWNRWYTQVFRARRISSTDTEHEFIFDYDHWLANGPSSSNRIVFSVTGDPGWADQNPPTPCICVGQAPDRFGVGANSGLSWGGYPGYEEFKGIIRGMQFYSARLSDSQIASELTTPGSATQPWYVNLNPTPTDVTDKSGSGQNPLWDGSSRPALWTQDAALADWQARSTAAGVTYATDFSGANDFLPTSTNGGHVHSDPNGWVVKDTTDGLTNGCCLRIDKPASSGSGTHSWIFPLNSAWTTNSQSFGLNTPFWIQFRFKIPPSRLLTTNPGDGWKWMNIAQYSPTDTDGFSFSNSGAEHVLEDTVQRGYPQAYHNPGFEGFSGTVGGQLSLENAIDKGASFSGGERYCWWNNGAGSPACFWWPTNEWLTFMVRIKVASYNGSPNAGNEFDLWVARKDATAWTHLITSTGHAVGDPNDGGGGFTGINGGHFSTYETGRVSGPQDTWHKYDQVIVSTQAIALPAVGA